MMKFLRWNIHRRLEGSIHVHICRWVYPTIEHYIWQTYHWSRLTHIYVSKLSQHWFRRKEPNYYFNQCWDIVEWPPEEQTSVKSWSKFIHLYGRNAFENVVWKMVAIFFLGLNVLTEQQCPRTQSRDMMVRDEIDNWTAGVWWDWVTISIISSFPFMIIITTHTLCEPKSKIEDSQWIREIPGCSRFWVYLTSSERWE